MWLLCQVHQCYCLHVRGGLYSSAPFIAACTAVHAVHAGLLPMGSIMYVAKASRLGCNACSWASVGVKLFDRQVCILVWPTVNPWLQLLCVYTPISLKPIMVCLEPECLMPCACMECRGVFGEAQNALRARSVQRVQLWKGLQPSALSEAVSHFTKVHLSCSWHCSWC